MTARRSWAVVLVASCWVVTGCQSVLGPTTPDANWNIHDSAHLSFYVRPGSFAEQNVATFGEVLDEQYAYTLARLELRYGGRISAFLYDSGADADLPDGSGVAYPRTEAVRVVCMPPLGANLISLMSHEVNHVLLRGALGRPGTTFVNEGLASTMISERHHVIGATFLYAWTRTNRASLPPLTDLIDDDKWQNYPSNVAYNSSASFLAYLLDTYGPGRLKEVYHASSAEFPGRFSNVYGRSLAAASEEWIAFCERR
jgi:hypothetical protein